MHRDIAENWAFGDHLVATCGLLARMWSMTGPARVAPGPESGNWNSEFPRPTSVFSWRQFRRASAQPTKRCEGPESAIHNPKRRLGGLVSSERGAKEIHVEKRAKGLLRLNSAGIAQMSSSGPNSANMGSNSVEFARMWPNLGLNGAKCGNRADVVGTRFGPNRTECGRSRTDWSNPGQTWPNSLADSVRFRPKSPIYVSAIFGGAWPSRSRNRGSRPAPAK